MIDETNDLNSSDQTPLPDELTLLKARADQLGISYHPKIGVPKLKLKIDLKLNPEVAKESIPETPEDYAVPEATQKMNTLVKNVVETARERTQRLKDASFRLIRIKVTCMNPAKTYLEGEIFTAGNSMIGSVKKFVPFNNVAGWHVPFIIYEFMKERQCQIFTNHKDHRGNVTRRGKLINEFSIEVMDKLTLKEINTLKEAQGLNRSIDV